MKADLADRIKCPVRKGVTHAPTFLSGHCTTGNHRSCHGIVTNGCGCVIPCRCTTPGHDHPHAYQEDPVLPSPFRVPGTDHPEALVQPEEPPAGVATVTTTSPQVSVEERSTWDTPTPARPWVDGTGAGAAPLEVMVRAFAMAAGDLHLHDDRYEDYDETAVLAMLGILRASVRRAEQVDAMLVKHLHDHGTWGRRLVDGLGEVRTYRRPKNVRWDERGTAEAIVQHHMEELGGEQPDPLTVVAWLLEAASIGYYRTTALEAMGIDPEDYRHKEKGTQAVDVPVPD